MRERIEKLMQAIPQPDQAILITSGVNRFYFTGFQSTAGSLLVTRDEAYFIIDFRYIEMAKQAISGCKVMLQDKLYEQMAELLHKHGVKKLFLETDYQSIREYLTVKKNLPDFEVVTDDAINNQILRLRQIKSKKEFDAIAKAQQIADAAFDDILNFIKPGVTELEIATQLRINIYRHGAQKESFDFIIASGKNSSKPHAHPTDKPVEAGDLVTMDFGALYDGYCSDMTRTVGVGTLSQEQVKLYNTVLDAQNAAFAVIKAGVPCMQVDAAARNLIDAAGYAGCFGHGLGHSLGIEIHEDPRFNTVDTTICEEGMVLSVEPGIYLEGKFGCRIEDIVYITKDGYHNFAHSPKNLILL